MNLSRSGIFCGGLLLLFFLYGFAAERQLADTFFDRLWLDEALSTAALDAVRNSVRESGDVAGTLPEVKPDEIWTRFLSTCEVLLCGLDEEWSERIPAAVLVTESGCYSYGRSSGWSTCQDWTEERTIQITEQLSESVRLEGRTGEPFQILLPFDDQEGWALAVRENALIVLFDSGMTPSEGVRYYRAAVGGAYRRHSARFYVVRSGMTFYHRESCPALAENEAGLEVYPDMESCAAQGAWPCPECIRQP